MPRSLQFLLTALALAVFAGHVAAQQNNVLLLVADDLGVDNIGAYQEGTTPPPTPHIDVLAANGVLFRNAWASAMCSPTRASIMTGRHAFRTGVGFALGVGVTRPLDPSEVTIPRVLDLAGSGLGHAAIGKWHLGYEARHPQQVGWSHFAGFPTGVPNYYRWFRTENGRTALTTVYATTQTVDDALAWISAQEGPWVCVVSFSAAHGPYHIPPAPLHTRPLENAGEPAVNPRPYFEAMVEAMDAEIGRLLFELGPVLSRTNVIFTADNGSAPGVILPPFDPCHGKGTPFEGGLNVPLIVAGPDVASPGREEQALVSTVDLFSTVTELAGVDARATVPPWIPLDSVSLVPYLANSGQAPLRNTVFTELYRGSDYGGTTADGCVAMRDARYKLIRFYSTLFPRGGVPVPCSPSGPFPVEALYDLQQDPHETTNLLAGTPTAGELQAQAALSAAIDQLRRPAGSFHTLGSPACMGTNGAPAIGATGVPTIGSTYDVDLSSAAPTGVVILHLGASYTSWQGMPLPLDLSRLGDPPLPHNGVLRDMRRTRDGQFPWAARLPLTDLPLFGAGSGCLLYTSIEASVATVTDAAGFAELAITVPPDPALVNLATYYSWQVIDPGAPGNSIGVTTSNGGVAVIGL